MSVHRFKGRQALARLGALLDRASDEDADTIVDGLTELADRTEAYLARAKPDPNLEPPQPGRAS